MKLKYFHLLLRIGLEKKNWLKKAEHFKACTEKKHESKTDVLPSLIWKVAPPPLLCPALLPEIKLSINTDSSWLQKKEVI